MTLAKITALVLYAHCLATGGNCAVDLEGRVTEYLSWKGDAMNCFPPCDKTAYMSDVVYGVTAACNGLPWNTKVAFWTDWGEQVVRYCQDVCPGCTAWPDGIHVDIAMPEDDNGRYYSPRPSGWVVLVELPQGENNELQHRPLDNKRN